VGIESFPADLTGFEELLGWLVGFGEVEQVGVEGTGSWGVGLTRFLMGQDIIVVEVDRPNRQKRRKVLLRFLSFPFEAEVSPRSIEALQACAASVPPRVPGEQAVTEEHKTRVMPLVTPRSLLYCG